MIAGHSYSVQNPLTYAPIQIEADKFEYIGDTKSGKVIAIGDVEAVQDDQKVTAKLIEYDFSKDILLAKDKVKILERTGYIIEADRVILSDRLTLGSIENFTIIMPDKSTLKGKCAKKETIDITKVDKGYFTSCKICPGKAPIWAITAKSTKLNEKNNSLEYRDAVMKFYGVPIIYTPYFFHYTNKAERKSGFLAPSYGGSSYLGTAVKIPYYFNIAPNQDATIKVIATKKQGAALEGEHRYLLPQGQINSSGSIASAKNYTPPSGDAKLKNDFRYNFNSKADLSLTESKNFGWDIHTTSDKAYLKDYGYGKENFLTSKVYNNSYQDNGYYEVQSLYFQNLAPNNISMNQTPIVLPLFESKHQLFNFDNGSRLNFESNFLKIHRYNGPDTNRISIKNRWEKDFLSEGGHDFKVFSSLRHDFYKYDDAIVNNKLYTGNTSRTIPEAGVNWSYPLMKSMQQSKLVLTPVVSAIATPYSKYNKNIYSEDSSNLSELSDSNLFSESQFNGIDLIENTPRVSYGLKGNLYYKDYLDANALFGQMYRQKPQEYMIGSEQGRLSDYVGRLQFDINNTVNFAYRYKLDKDKLTNKRNEIETTLRYKKMYITANLLYYKDNKELSGIKNRREIYLETGMNDLNGISASVNARKNLSTRRDNPNLYVDPNGFVSVGGKVKYFNDCILYKFEVSRDYTKNNNTKPSTTYWFDISFKNIS